MARATITRDGSGRITSYHAKEAPSRDRMREILRQAEKSGAKKVGLVADVAQFQAYENKEAARQMVRDYRNTPASLRESIQGRGSMHATGNLLGELKAASGAERVSGLNGFNLNFIY